MFSKYQSLNSKQIVGNAPLSTNDQLALVCTECLVKAVSITLKEYIFFLLSSFAFCQERHQNIKFVDLSYCGILKN